MGGARVRDKHPCQHAGSVIRYSEIHHLGVTRGVTTTPAHIELPGSLGVGSVGRGGDTAPHVLGVGVRGVVGLLVI